MTEKIFEGQREDEQVEMLFRRHFTVWLLYSFPFLISFYGILGVFYFRLSNIFLYISISLTVFCLLILMYKIMLWHYSYFILTNQRIRCVQRNGFFAQSIVDISLKTITNTQYQESGFIGSILYKYGHINIESISADLYIERVANAKKVYNKLQDLLEYEDYEKED